MNKDDVFPVVIFVYNRLSHTISTLEALKANTLAEKTELYIYSDGPKDDVDKCKVESVRNFLDDVSGFKKVTIIKSDSNSGLKNSIIKGVSEVISLKGAVIVLEDDVITNVDFLTYMNKCLKKYKDEHNVWHVNSWFYPIDSESEFFFSPVMNCWGWGTWQNRWDKLRVDVDEILDNYKLLDRLRFDLGWSGEFWSQVIMNANGTINTWAIFWYATIFNNNGLCLTPPKQFSSNIGFDGSGTHCDESSSYSPISSESVGEFNLPNIVSVNKRLLLKTVFFLYKKRFNHIANKIISR